MSIETAEYTPAEHGQRAQNAMTKIVRVQCNK